jgi:hypothetical protein
VWSAIDGHQLSSTVPLRRPGEEATTLFSTDRAFVVSSTLTPHGDVTMWSMPSETRSPIEVQRIVSERSPWRLELGALVER